MLGVRRPFIIACVLLSFTLTAAAGFAARQAPTPAAAVARVLESAGYQAAVAFLDRTHDQLVSETILLTEIPAPPFKETARGRAFLEMLRQAGLTAVEADAEGNVMGLRRGTAPAGGPLLAIAAHLDTVFPEGTDVKVKRTGTRLAAPGISDNTRGLAVLLAVVRAMNDAKIQTSSDILFVGNVGEEGPGDLRGVRYMFQKGKYKDRIKTFIAVDGSGGGDDITNGGVGSKRYRATFKGPGGHSYGAFGLVNPAFAMGGASAKIGQIRVPSSPRTTYSIGVVGGGTSVNSIPFETWMDIDLRSESPVELDKLDKQINALVRQAVDEENVARSTVQGGITLDMKLIGDRPSGQTPATAPIVQIADAVVIAAGMTPRHSYSSTDSNIPMSLGIPAITLDSGGRGGRAHALDEWIDVEKGPSVAGVRNILAILVSAAGMP
jgi:tripeptide aminopeptidase